MIWSKLLSSKQDGNYFQEPDASNAYYRSPFEKEYHYIVGSPAFRRLQDKTQVFPLDSSDFVRTRLTHSIETSSLAKTLANMVTYYMLNNNSYNNSTKFADIRSYNDSMKNAENDISNILMCAGLLHDIGNPPFGHFGETIIRDWFKENLPKLKYKNMEIDCYFGQNSQMLNDFYHFEGNAQALRLLTKLHFQNDSNGLHLTYALLNTLIKYPTASAHIEGRNAGDICRKKMGYFYAENEAYYRLAYETGTMNKRHPLTYLLEAADDIAYATADLEDAFKKGMFTYDQLITEFSEYDWGIHARDNHKQRTAELYEILESLRQHAICQRYPEPEMYAIRNWIPHVQYWFLYCASYAFTSNYNDIMSGEYRYDLFHNANHEHTIRILSNVMQTYVYPSAVIEKLEIAAHSIITNLLDKFINAALYFELNDLDWPMNGVDEKLMRLIPPNYYMVYKNEREGKDEKEQLYLRLLMITDFICGMSDSYAKSLYQDLAGIY